MPIDPRAESSPSCAPRRLSGEAVNHIHRAHRRLATAPLIETGSAGNGRHLRPAQTIFPVS